MTVLCLFSFCFLTVFRTVFWQFFWLFSDCFSDSFSDYFLPVFFLFSDGFSDCFLTVFLTVFWLFFDCFLAVTWVMNVDFSVFMSTNSELRCWRLFWADIRLKSCWTMKDPVVGHPIQCWHVAWYHRFENTQIPVSGDSLPTGHSWTKVFLKETYRPKRWHSSSIFLRIFCSVV